MINSRGSKPGIDPATHNDASAPVHLRSGLLAGAIAAVAFTAIHHIFISNIWYALFPMMVAGALCGMCIAWTYRLLIVVPSPGSWLRYNLTYLALFGVLASASLIAFEPVSTIQELMAVRGPPEKLIGQAMPVTVGFVLLAAALVGLLFGRRWWHFGPILVTVAVLVLFLGLNVSVTGLVEFGAGDLHLLAELFGLILVLNGAFVATFIALEWRNLMRPLHAGSGDGRVGRDPSSGTDDQGRGYASPQEARGAARAADTGRVAEARKDWRQCGR
ncbi:MAG: hypothetical protein H0U52_01125 [Chloroflexi bacterium]|nr:hypothetical protein [Chloroflexota bacterium]